MNLKEFMDTHCGEYAKVGASSGWLWTGEITDHTLGEINEIIRMQRSHAEKRLNEERNRRVISKKTASIIRKLEKEVNEKSIPAQDREVISHSISTMDVAHLVKISGNEVGKTFELRELKNPTVIPFQYYRAFCAELVEVAGTDLRDSAEFILRDEMDYFSNMAVGQQKNDKAREYSKKRIEAERIYHETVTFFDTDLYKMICPDISRDALEEMTQRSVRRSIMQEWKKKAELYEKRIRKNRQSHH